MVESHPYCRQGAILKHRYINASRGILFLSALTLVPKSVYAAPAKENCEAAYAALDYMLPKIWRQQSIVMSRGPIFTYPVKEKILIKEAVSDLTRREDIAAGRTIVTGWHVAPPAYALARAFINSGRSSALSCSAVRGLAHRSHLAIGRLAEATIKADAERSDRIGQERKFQVLRLSAPIVDRNKGEALAYFCDSQGRRSGFCSAVLLRNVQGRWRAVASKLISES